MQSFAIHRQVASVVPELAWRGHGEEGRVEFGLEADSSTVEAATCPACVLSRLGISIPCKHETEW